MNYIRIVHKGKSYILEMIVGEHLDEAYQRLWKIIQHVSNISNISNMPKSNNIERVGYLYEQIVNVSKLWYYKNRYGCQYPPENERFIALF